MLMILVLVVTGVDDPDMEMALLAAPPLALMAKDGGGEMREKPLFQVLEVEMATELWRQLPR